VRGNRPGFSGVFCEGFDMNKIRNWGAASLATLAGASQAAVPTEVTTALGTMQTDALAVAGLVLVAIIAVAAFKFMRKGF
jgi:hypothetical protein